MSWCRSVLRKFACQRRYFRLSFWSIHSSKETKLMWNMPTMAPVISRTAHTDSEWTDAETIVEDDEISDFGVDISAMKLGASHNVFVIQPKILGNLRPDMHNTTPELQMAESLALVDSLPGWKAAGNLILGTRTPDDMEIFSKVRMKTLCNAIADLHVSAIFISIDRINGMQKKFLMESTNVEDVFDRYTLVLEIFRLRAQTKQAKLQVALAEIPYLKSNLKADITSINRQGKGFGAIGGPGETPLELMMRRFKIKEQRIRQRLAQLSRKRAEHRQARKRNQVPIVAVVGYTNAGKTTLIKALTGSAKLQPKNHLFATLDVTAHAASTSGDLNYVLVDTVGFLSNIPHSLIDAFSATMEDMLQADIIIHVCDLSHPDCLNQRKNVYKVLCDLNIPDHLIENMIEVQNKIDVLEGPNPVQEQFAKERGQMSKTAIKRKKHLLEARPTEVCMVSATEGTGMKELRELLHDRIYDLTGSGNVQIRIPADGNHFDWFDQYATVVSTESDGDYHFIVELTISEPMLNKFKATYSNYRILN